MKPFKFSRANTTLKAGGIPDVVDMPVWRGVNTKNISQTISFWKGTPAELHVIACNGGIYLSVMGNSIPPMQVFAAPPFVGEVQAITKIEDVGQISKSLEGRLLLAALAKITTESEKDKTPDQVIEQLNKLADRMFTE